MTLIAVTMLRLFDARRREWRDAVDERWSIFLRHCNILPLYLPNNPEVAEKLLDRLQPNGVLLTGGGSCQALSGFSDWRDDTEDLLLQWAQRQGVPALGVCRGMQVMVSRAGGILEPVKNHVGVHEIYYQGQLRRVNSFHEYGFRVVPSSYEINGISRDGVIEAVRSKKSDHFGIMWHPERNKNMEDTDLSLVRKIYEISK